MFIQNVKSNHEKLFLANTWQEKLTSRTMRKEGESRESIPQIIRSLTPWNLEVKTNEPRLIFNREELDRSEEETKKLQQVHEELENISFYPSFA